MYTHTHTKQSDIQLYILQSQNPQLLSFMEKFASQSQHIYMRLILSKGQTIWSTANLCKYTVFQILKPAKTVKSDSAPTQNTTQSTVQADLIWLEIRVVWIE